MEKNIYGRQNQGQQSRPQNVVLVGVMGSGKTAVGWQLARIMGMGFLDIDHHIEGTIGKKIKDIFSEEGEAHFRQLERDAVAEMKSLRNHVLAVGGGSVIDDENWKLLKHCGVTVWLDTPPSEIARRLVMKPDEIMARPLIQDVVNATSKDERFKMLHDRIEVLIRQRSPRYKEADVVVKDAYSTPEAAANSIRHALTTASESTETIN